MEQMVQVVIDYMDVWGYTAIVVLMALESACIPVPSELIFGFAGYLVYLGRIEFTIAVVAGVIGGLIGSIVAYLVGYFGGKPFVLKYGKYIFLSKQHVEMAQKWFDRYGLQAVFYSRLLPILRTFISLPAGFAGVDFVKFIIYTVLGSIPWTIALLYGGMLLGENWKTINEIGHQASLIVGLGIVVVAGYYFMRSKRKLPGR